MEEAVVMVAGSVVAAILVGLSAPASHLTKEQTRKAIDGDPNVIHLGLLLKRPEFRFGEVLVPWSVIVGALGFLTAWLVVAIMEYTDLSRHIWHLPLSFVGLVVLFSSLIGMAISP